MRPFANVKGELLVTQNGIILRGERIVIPKVLRNKAIELAHEGHQGIVKTKALIRTKVWFPGIDNAVEKIIEGCIPSLAATNSKTRNPLQMSKLPMEPWSELYMDFLGPFPDGRLLLVVVDNYSRYPLVRTASSTAAKTVNPLFRRIFAKFSIPRICRTDNGPPFNGEEFR